RGLAGPQTIARPRRVHGGGAGAARRAAQGVGGVERTGPEPVADAGGAAAHGRLLRAQGMTLAGRHGRAGPHQADQVAGAAGPAAAGVATHAVSAMSGRALGVAPGTQGAVHLLAAAAVHTLAAADAVRVAG